MIRKLLLTHEIQQHACIIRNISVSARLHKRRPPDYRSLFRHLRFPFLKVHYDNDSMGPREVITNRWSTYPPGKWGSMSVKRAWEMHDLASKYHNINNLMDKYQEMSWDEFNLFYHDIKLPILFPETLNFSKFITRTKLIEDDVPESIKINSNHIFLDDISKTSNYVTTQINNYLSKSAPFIVDYDESELKRNTDRLIGQSLEAVIRSIISEDFLQNYATASVSKIESFFKRGGYDDQDFSRDVKDDDGFVKYKICSELAWSVRCRHPLQPFISPNDDSLCNVDGSAFVNYNYDPKLFDLTPDDNLEFRCQPKRNHPKWEKGVISTCMGTWGDTLFKIGDPCMFSVLGAINTRRSKPIIDEYSDIVDPVSIVGRHFMSEAVFHGFTWCLAQAQAQGFTIYDELPYPFCTSLLLTDGCNIQMTYYQLNNINGLWKPEDANESVNVCWMGPMMQLFETDDVGRIKEVNQSVIHHILTSLTMPVCKHMDTQSLQPYLSPAGQSPRIQPTIDESESFIASRDRTGDFLLSYDANKATEKQQKHYSEVICKNIDQPFSWNMPHHNRIWLFNKVTKFDMFDKMRKIVPNVDNLPEWYIDMIEKTRRAYKNHRKGKKRYTPEAPLK